MNEPNTKVNDLDINELNKLTNEELRDKILNVNKKQLTKIGQMSYYYIIGTSGEMIQLIKEKGFIQELESKEEKKLIIKDFDYIIDSFKKFHSHISQEEINDKIKELLDIRNDLYNLSNALEGYIIELSYIKEIFDFHTMKIAGKEEYKNIHINEKELILLINKIGDILADKTKDHYEFISIVSDILSIVPFRMSKSKYFDVLKSTLIRNLKYYPISLAKNRIEDYKMLFDSSLNRNYGIVFDNYFTSIQRFKNTKVGDHSLEELDRIAKDIVDFSFELTELKVFINALGVLVNRLVVIYMIKDKNLFNENLKNIYSNWKEYLSEIDKDILDSLIEESKNEFARVENQLINHVEFFESLKEEGLARKGFFDENLNSEMLFTSEVLAYYNDIEFINYEILFPEYQERIDLDYLEQLIDNLIQYINRSISSMSNIERKLRMRRLLSALELPFVGIEEFLSYIEYSLDERIVSREERLFTIDAITYWLDELKEGQ